MGQWVITVAGIAILSVLCDIVLPEGQTRKYVKTVFGVVVTLVIVQPLIGLFDSNASHQAASYYADYNDVIQQQYVDNTLDRQARKRSETIVSLLEANSIDVESVDVTNYDITIALKSHETYDVERKIKNILQTLYQQYDIIIVWV